MNEQQKGPLSPAGEANEVVLEYISEPKPYVAYYVQDRPLPGRRPEQPPAPGKARRSRRGFKIFLVCILVLLLLVGILTAAWWFGLFSSPRDDSYDDPYGYYDFDDSDAETTISTVPTTDTVRLRYSETHGAALSIQEIYKKVNPSTVTVVAELPRSGASIGTGVIMTQDGYIITNAHVIAGGQSCFIVLDNGTRYEAGLVGYDTEKDLAVIKALDAENLPAAEFGDSDALTVGDTVYAIGNPLGVELRGTLTDGIVSAINRDVNVDGITMTLIQTNAALNNGNSGGPLINEYGQVVGINVMKMGMNRYSTASVEGLGFAIPISSSAYMINDLLRCGEVLGEPVLGISVDTKPAFLPSGEQALRVYSIDLGGPGDKAGLRVDDLIVEADGARTVETSDLLRVRHRHAAGDQMTLKVYRDGGFQTISVTLEAKK